MGWSYPVILSVRKLCHGKFNLIQFNSQMDRIEAILQFVDGRFTK